MHDIDGRGLFSSIADVLRVVGEAAGIQAEEHD
jgi:hypothetical protein